MCTKLFQGGKIAIFIVCLILFSSFPSQLMAKTFLDAAQQQAMEEAEEFLADSTNWAFHSGAHLRTSFNTLSNTVDLDKRNHSDENFYVGYAYDFTLDLRHISGSEVYAFIEQRGRADYDAPLSGERTIDTLFGRYHWYHREDMLPRLREFWTELPLADTDDLNVQFGLFPYGRGIGHGIALGGKYENYGVTFSGTNESLDWNLHYEKEDLNNRVHIGKVVDFDKVNAYNDTSAYFYAGDATFKLGQQSVQLYLGWLQDWTPEGARSSRFNTVVKKEDLITLGSYFDFNLGKLNLGFEGAKNFGEARTIDDSQYNDIKHKGYLLIGEANYDLGSFKPKGKVFVASGNKMEETNYNASTFSSDENRAFSVFSPLNTNLTDTHYQKQFGPYVAMAGGYAVNFGISRPGTFGDPFMFENIVASTVGFDYTPVDKVYMGMDYWYLRAKEHGYGLDEGGNITSFSKELGHELDIFASYQWTKNMKISLLAGYFFPGKYYTETRTDNATNIFAPTPRRDGEADGVYQIELGLDITF